jgi:putative membrane protein
MAFGFVVERFALFVRQMEYLLGRTIFAKGAAETAPVGHGYSAVLGIVLVALGALMGVLSFIRYKKVEKQIDGDAYRPSVILDVLLTISVLVIGMFLIAYLVRSV